MEEPTTGTLGQWLQERCKEEGLSLRQASARTGLSHATIGDIVKGARATGDTIRKLAQAFGTGGDHHKLALEDQLLVLAGYRSARPKEKEFSEPMARLLDKLSDFNEPQLKLVMHFTEFIAELEAKR